MASALDLQLLKSNLVGIILRSLLCFRFQLPAPITDSEMLEAHVRDFDLQLPFFDCPGTGRVLLLQFLELL